MKNTIENFKTPDLIQDIGMRYPYAKAKYKKKYGLYKCSCGETFEALKYSVESGSTKSCGCARYGKRVKHGMSKTKLYLAYTNMIRRCHIDDTKHRKDYAMKGISVCDEWKHNFIEFANWANKNGYEEGLTLDRIDNDKGYNPDNCRWVTVAVQNRNQRLLRSTNSSGYKGVFFKNENKKYRAVITVNRKHFHLGYFDDPKHAAMAYDTFVIVYGLEHTQNFS